MDTIHGYTNLRPCDSIFSPITDMNLATFLIKFCNVTYPILGRRVYVFDDNTKKEMTNLGSADIGVTKRVSWGEFGHFFHHYMHAGPLA